MILFVPTDKKVQTNNVLSYFTPTIDDTRIINNSLKSNIKALLAEIKRREIEYSNPSGPTFLFSPFQPLKTCPREH